MKIKVTGTNYWSGIKTYLHTSLEKQPTPFMTYDIDENEIISAFRFYQFDEPKEVELKKGDYVMLITDEDWIRDKDRSCGHMHYFDGKDLISVYTKKKFKDNI